jgi:Ca-activated chloride channel homolog
MLKIKLKPHREFVPAEQAEQKLFVMLKLTPNQEVSNSRPPTNFAFVIDTSGSMYEGVADGKTKLDIVAESIYNLIHSGGLTPSDRIALIQFSDDASTLIGLTPATQTPQLESVIGQFYNYGGGTRMGLGMSETLNVMTRDQQMSARRALIFTDGQTFDEDLCYQLASEFASHNIPITALGVGDYNEDILIPLSNTTGGRLHHVTPNQIGGATGSIAVSIANLPTAILQEFNQAQQEVVTNLSLTVKTMKGIKVNRVFRAYPTIAEYSLVNEPYPLGNAEANDDTVFILEFSLETRPASRVRIAQVALTYDLPGLNRRGELPVQDLVVEFVAGQLGVQNDQEVMGYIQQCNLGKMLEEAANLANSDPQKADQILQNAQRLTKRIGNERLTRSLGQAQDELRKTRNLSEETRKTVKMGSKGKTVKMSDGDINEQISDEQIRRALGN